jgi:uncharacterized protein YkwD
MKNEEVYRGLRTATFLAAAIAMAMGCAGLANANKRSPGKTANGQFTPDATYPPEANYGPDPKLSCPRGGPNGAIEDLLKQQDLKGKKVIADGRLCAMADTMLGWQADAGELLPEKVRVFISSYFGLPIALPSRAFLLQDVDVDMKKPVDIAAGMMGPMVSFAESAKAPRYGFVAERIGTSAASHAVAGEVAGKTRVRLIMYDEQVVIDPLPRALPAGGTATLSGHIEGEVKNLKIQVVDPVGKLKTTEAKDSTFSAPIACGDHNGKMLVQITGDSDSGEVKLASMPIVCGGQLATFVPVAGKGTAGPVDPAAGEKTIADSINADRSAASLKTLNVSAPLSEIARALAEKQAAGKGVNSADLTQMLKEKDVTAPSIAESAARASSAEEAYDQLANNPSDRANQMSADMTDIGIGVAKGPDMGGKPSVIVTMLYVKQLPPADPVEAKAKLYEAIEKKREGAKLEPLKKDPTLESVAQKYADAAAKVPSGQVPKDQESEIMAPLYKASMVVNQMGGWMPDEANALQFAEQPSIVGKARHVGVGMALGRSDRFGKNSLFILVLVGTKQDAAKPARKPGKKR